jgi:hypothetical protein
MGKAWYNPGNWQSATEAEEALKAYAAAEATLGDGSDGVGEAEARWWQEWLEIQLERMMLHYWRAQTEAMGKIEAAIRPVVERYSTPVQRADFYVCLFNHRCRCDGYSITDETFHYAQTALAAARKAGDLGRLGLPLIEVGFSHMWRGELAEAEERLREGLQVGERVGDLSLQTLCLTYLTVTYRRAGRLEETCRHAVLSHEAAALAKMTPYMGVARANQAWGEWRRGNLPAAWEHGQAALVSLPEVYAFRWLALWPLIAVARVEDCPADAIAHARTLFSPHEQRLPDKLATVLESAIQAWEAGHSETACRHLEEAIRLAEVMRYL